MGTKSTPGGRPDPSRVLVDLRRRARDPVEMRRLRRLLGETTGDPNVGRLSDEEVLRRLSGHVASGRVPLAGTTRHHAPVGGARRREAEEPAREAAPFEREERTHIGLQVVLDRNGRPVEGVTLKVTLPDGSEVSTPTDSQGKVVHDGLSDGTCSVTCDIRGARLASTLAFTGMGPGAAGAEEETEPLTGFRCIADVDHHKVKTGDNLKRLAEANGLTWQQLAEFNWNTSVPKQVNKALRDVVGCTKKTPDGVNYRFDDSDEPGIVHIPRTWTQTGLATGKTHVIRVTDTTGFRIVLENEEGLRIPEAEYEATLADDSTRTGRLGIGGVAILENPPPGEVEVVFPDLDDIEAKSLAASIRKAFDDRDPQRIYRVLHRTPTMLRDAIAAYAKYYDDYTGEGMVEDVCREITDPLALEAVLGLLVHQGILTEDEAMAKSREG